jgi:excisionase family DNA binding protein
MGDMPESMWSPEQVAEYLSVPKATVYRWRVSGDGPKGARVGKHVRYRPADVASWFDAQVAEGSRHSSGRVAV